MNDITWSDWLRSFREHFVAANKWTEKEAKLRIRDGWAVVRDGRVHVLANDDPRPSGAVPVFLTLTPGGWKLPIEIIDCRTGLVGKAMSSQRSPRDIVLGLLSQIEHADGQDEDDETRQKRHKASFWIWQLLDACEDEVLAGVVGSDVFGQVVLSAFQAGNCHAILELYRNPQLLADLIKAQAFQSGRKADEVSRRLEASYLEQRAKLGRDPSSLDVTRAAGGVWSALDECWQFDGLKGLPDVTPRGICERLKDIRRKHRRPVK